MSPSELKSNRVGDAGIFMDNAFPERLKYNRINRVLRAVILPSRPKYLYGTSRLRKMRIHLYERLAARFRKRITESSEGDRVDVHIDTVDGERRLVENAKIIHPDGPVALPVTTDSIVKGT